MMTTSEAIGVKEQGNVFIVDDKYDYQVRNVRKSSEVDRGNMTDFWNRSIELDKHKCGIVGCDNAAVEGGHVWLRPGERRLDTFCFIMPICKTCNNCNGLKTSFKSIKKGAILVARDTKKGME